MPIATHAGIELNARHALIEVVASFANAPNLLYYLRQCYSLMCINMLHMRPLPDEYSGAKACNDADSRPALRHGVHRISLPAPLDAQAGSTVQTGLSSSLSSQFMGPLYWDAVEVLARTPRRAWQAGHRLHHRLPSLCEMGQ